MRRSAFVFFVLSLGMVLAAFAQAPSKAKRVAPPTKWPEDVRSMFPDDAVKELKGDRPNFGGAAKTPTNAVATGGGTPAAGTTEPAATGGGNWSKNHRPGRGAGRDQVVSKRRLRRREKHQRVQRRRL
ncbi:MAG: hypothetical protein QM811_02305 [Pirellulales bacterium]